MRPAFLPRARAQRGSTMIELAGVALLMAALLPALMLFGRVFYQYSVIKSSCHSAALYMALLPPAAFRDPDEMARAKAVAQQMVASSIVEAGISGASTLSSVDIRCDGIQCQSGKVPTVINVNMAFSIDDLGFGNYPGNWMDDGFWNLSVTSSVPNLN
jgi:Flp pilus assembly protein TadG